MRFKIFFIILKKSKGLRNQSVLLRKGESASVVEMTKEYSEMKEEELEYIESRYNLKLKWFYWSYGTFHMFFKRGDVIHD